MRGRFERVDPGLGFAASRETVCAAVIRDPHDPCCVSAVEEEMADRVAQIAAVAQASELALEFLEAADFGCDIDRA